MRAKLILPSTEWLPGDFEAPGTVRAGQHLTVWRAHPDRDRGHLAMKLGRGTGLWDSSGKLLLHVKRGADMAWLNESGAVLSLESAFGKCEGSGGVAHVLRRLDADSLQQLDEAQVCVPSGGVEYLVLDHSRQRALATWLDQADWGYVMLDLRTMQQTPVALRWPSPTLAPPDFSPDDQLVVACHFVRHAWWNAALDDAEEHPSPGGRWTVSTMTVHDLASGAVSRHEVMIDLPAGWIPDEPYGGSWGMVWGPEFTSPRELKIWLPDGSTEVLTLPLPPEFVVSRPLSRTRVV